MRSQKLMVPLVGLLVAISSATLVLTVMNSEFYKVATSTTKYSDNTVSFNYPDDWHTRRHTNIPEGNLFNAVTYFNDQPIVLRESENFFPVTLFHYPTDVLTSNTPSLFTDIRSEGQLIDTQKNVYYLSGVSEMGQIPYEAYLHISEQGAVIVYAHTGSPSATMEWQEAWDIIENSLEWK